MFAKWLSIISKAYFSSQSLEGSLNKSRGGDDIYTHIATYYLRMLEVLKKPPMFFFFKRGGGSCPNPNVSRTFFVMFMFGHILVRGWGLPNSKQFEGLFC